MIKIFSYASDDPTEVIIRKNSSAVSRTTRFSWWYAFSIISKEHFNNDKNPGSWQNTQIHRYVDINIYVPWIRIITIAQLGEII